MLEQQTTIAAERGANVVVDLIPVDDVIPCITGVTLADADAQVIARRLRATNWKGRARFFNNIIFDSIENMGKMVECAKTGDDGRRFLDWSMCEIMRRIGEVLDLWGETKRKNKDAAFLLFLSLKPAHHRAAVMFLSTQGPKLQATMREQWTFANEYRQKHWQTLAVFYRMTAAGNPAAAAAWSAGSQECPEDWFDPTKVPGGADEAEGDDAA